jgi:hypothetical protein
MNDKDIIKISHVKNVRVRNIHNNVLFPNQNILKVYFRNGEIRTLDLFSNKDMTEVDYFKIVETPRTKEKLIFNDKD